MPKAKPDQVIVHRIELQETERATLEAALAGRFVTNAAQAAGNLLNGIGAALAPFSGAISALAALWIADRTIEEIQEAVKVTKKAGEDLIDWISPEKTRSTFEYIVAYFTACDGWDGVISRGSELMDELENRNASPVLKNRLYEFIKSAKMTYKTTGQWPPYSPEKAWTKFYTPQDYYRDHGLAF